MPNILNILTAWVTIIIAGDLIHTLSEQGWMLVGGGVGWVG